MEHRLADIIRAEIERVGPISFARFMELALYYPDLGYYRRKNASIFGQRGDFYTANQLQPVYGEILSRFVSNLPQRLGPPDSFAVLELGAGRQDLRAALQPWNYRAFDWDTPPLPQSMSGLVIANEFFDALPVHLLQRRKTGWGELVVRRNDKGFVFGQSGDLPPALADYARQYGASIPEGGLLEVNLAAADWIKKIGELLISGDLLVLDYGYDSRELVRFPQGTLLGYQRHQTTTDLLAQPGERDITAHVNFTFLREHALHIGWEIVSDSTLRDWVLRLWSHQELEARWNQADVRWRLQWKQLVFGMGDTFRVLHLHKRDSVSLSPK